MAEHGSADESLLAAAGQGNMEAFAELVNRHQGWAWRLAFRFLGEAQISEDVVQEAFLRLFRAAPRFSPRAAFRTYFYRIIARLCLDQARKKHPRFTDRPPEPADPAPDAAGRIIEQETSAAVRAALDELPDNQRMAVVLRYYEALDYRSIGETLEISPKAVERLLARARMRLGVLLKT